MTTRRWFFDDPSLEEQERLAAENAAALEDPNYIDPWDAMLSARDHQCALPHPGNHAPGTVARCSTCGTTFVAEGITNVLVIWVREEVPDVEAL